MRQIHMDWETSSTVSVKDVGAYAYAMHPDTRIECLSYALDQAEPRMWLPGMPVPHQIEVVLGNMHYEFTAHNAQFEYAIWHHVAARLYGWPPVPPFERWRDTMAACAYRAVPLALENVGKVLGLSEQKKDTGKALLDRLHLPAGDPRRTLTAEEREQLWDYNRQDIRTERQLDETLGPLPASEQRIWCLNQRINERGVKIDLETAHAAVNIAETVAERLNGRIEEITKGHVERGTQGDRIRKWSLDYCNYEIPDVQAETVDALLMDPTEAIPWPVREVLQLRRQVAKSSVSKYRKMIECVCPDDRVRGTLQYHAAHTGREGGRLIQTQNFPRPSDEDLDMDLLVETIRSGDPDLLEMIYGDPLVALADGLRPTITCEVDAALVGGDFSAVEAIGTAWLAGETWKLDAFREIFAGRGYKGSDDIYCATASQILAKPVSKKEDPQGRQVGKTAELAFGFGGGLGAWLKFDNSGRFSEGEIDHFKTSWRAAHPAIKKLWDALESCALRAVCYPCQTFETHGITFFSPGQDWLTVRLPSGKLLWYRSPQVSEMPVPWLTSDGDQAMRPQLRYWAWKAGQWVRDYTYGGKLCENIVQAICRDLLMHGALNAEAAGVPLILTVHDELLGEISPAGRADPNLLTECMIDLPDWARGFPISAPAWVDRRWRK